MRKVQQAFWIEGDIWVTVLAVERDRVKIGITAPGNIKVMRQELFGEDGALTPANGPLGGGSSVVGDGVPN